MLTRKAFTIIELLAVIAIIIILAGILVTTARHAFRAADEAVCISNMKSWGITLALKANIAGGQLPSLANASSPLYAADSALKTFFTDPQNGLSPKIAYCPAWPPGRINQRTGQWLTEPLTLYQPDPGSAKIIDDSTSLSQSVDTYVDDSTSGSYSETGSWAGFGFGYNSTLRQLDYVASPNGTAKWSFTLPPGTGNLEVKAFWHGYPTRATNVFYKILTDDGQEQTVGPISQRLDPAEAQPGSWRSLGTFPFNGGGTRYVKLTVTGADGTVIADAIRVTGTVKQGGVNPVNVTVDNVAPAYSKVGSWTPFTGTSFWPNTSTATCDQLAPGTGTATWTFTLPAGTGNLFVEAYFDKGTTRPPASCITYEIGTSGTEKATASIDQYASSGGWGWYPIGTFAFTGDGTRYVKLTVNTASTTYYAIADAVRISGGLREQSPGPVNAFEALSGIWQEYTGESNAYANQYRKVASGAHDSATARWLFSLPAAGSWGVFYKWPASSGLSQSVPFNVQHANGTSTVTLNERIADSEWVKLAEKSFLQNTQYEVSTSCMPDGPVAADAVMLARVLPVTKDPGPRIGYLYLGYRDGLPGKVIGDWTMPSTLSECDPTTTPILVDIFSTNQPTMSAHQGELVHVLALDGRVDRVIANKVQPRWTDAYGITYGW